ncbi:MAG: hypothetical protein ABR514_10720, partial [Chthoniobacterales bacterium]
LSQHCGADDVLTPIEPPVAGHEARNYRGFFNALPEILAGANRPRATGSDLIQRRKFYNHMPALLAQKRIAANIWRNYFKFCVERNPWNKVLSHYHMNAQRAGSLSLDQYFNAGKFPLNFPRYTDHTGQRVIVDRVLRYEKLSAELGEVFSQLGIPFDGSLGVNAKSEYRIDRTPYQLVFNEEQRRTIEQVFAREIELHGYRFQSDEAFAVR